MTPAPHYVTVYEFSPFLIAGWPFFIGGLVMAIITWLRVFPGGRLRDRVVVTLGAGSVFLGFAYLAWTSIGRHVETIAQIDAGNIKVIEGVTTDVECIAKGRQAFSVGPERFEPSDSGFQPGFQAASIFSNSLRGGMRVRVHYFDSSWGHRVITKLENDTTTGLLPPGIKLIGPCGN